MLLTSTRKMMLSTALLLVSMLLFIVSQRPWSAWAFAGMALSWAADAMLAQFPRPLQRIRKSFFFGAILFAIAHVCYIHGMVNILLSWGYTPRFDEYALVYLPFFILCVLHWLKYFKVEKSSRHLGFSVAATSYLLLVGGMASMAVRLGVLSQGRLWSMSLGAVLFFMSDIVLVRREYRRTSTKWTAYVIWSTYVAAQLLLMINFAIA